MDSIGMASEFIYMATGFSIYSNVLSVLKRSSRRRARGTIIIMIVIDERRRRRRSLITFNCFQMEFNELLCCLFLLSIFGDYG